VQGWPKVDHSERSQAQLRDGDRAWTASVERRREPTNKTWIEGGADSGKRAIDREALVIQDQAAQICWRCGEWLRPDQERSRLAAERAAAAAVASSQPLSWSSKSVAVEAGSSGQTAERQ